MAGNEEAAILLGFRNGDHDNGIFVAGGILAPVDLGTAGIELEVLFRAGGRRFGPNIDAVGIGQALVGVSSADAVANGDARYGIGSALDRVDVDRELFLEVVVIQDLTFVHERGAFTRAVVIDGAVLSVLQEKRGIKIEPGLMIIQVDDAVLDSITAPAGVHGDEFIGAKADAGVAAMPAAIGEEGVGLDLTSVGRELDFISLVNDLDRDVDRGLEVGFRVRAGLDLGEVERDKLRLRMIAVVRSERFPRAGVAGLFVLEGQFFIVGEDVALLEVAADGVEVTRNHRRRGVRTFGGPGEVWGIQGPHDEENEAYLGRHAKMEVERVMWCGK